MKLTKEERSAKRAAANKALKRDAAAVAPKKIQVRRPDTPAVIAHREQMKVWSKNNKERRKEINMKFADKAKLKILEAIAQADATRRKTEQAMYDIEDAERGDDVKTNTSMGIKHGIA